jgi:hypothetical protein
VNVLCSDIQRRKKRMYIEWKRDESEQQAWRYVQLTDVGSEDSWLGQH